MSEHDNLQDADGDNLNATPQENSTTETPTTSQETPTEKIISSETAAKKPSEIQEVVDPTDSAKKETSD